jgi:hypothetical protein
VAAGRNILELGVAPPLGGDDGDGGGARTGDGVGAAAMAGADVRVGAAPAGDSIRYF